MERFQTFKLKALLIASTILFGFTTQNAQSSDRLESLSFCLSVFDGATHFVSPDALEATLRFSVYENENTLLHYAASENNLDALSYLIARNADPFVQNKDGKTPLDFLPQDSISANLLREHMKQMGYTELSNLLKTNWGKAYEGSPLDLTIEPHNTLWEAFQRANLIKNIDVKSVQILGRNVIRVLDLETKKYRTFKHFAGNLKEYAEAESSEMETIHHVLLGKPLRFGVARYRKTQSDSFLEVETVFGRVLDDILFDETIAEIAKKQIYNLYHRRRLTLWQSLRASGFKPNEKADFQTLPTYEQTIWGLKRTNNNSPTAESEEIVLHTQNVIVDVNTLDMTIIDPN